MGIDDIILQRIIAVAGMFLWLVFPIGIFISVVKQDREALPPKKINDFKDYQLHPPYYEDSFKEVKIGIEKELEEPKMDDFSHQHVTISPGPDNKHTDL